MQSQNAFLVGILGNHVFRHREAAKFLSYFRTWDLIVERLSRYVDRTRRNQLRKSRVIVPPTQDSPRSVSVANTASEDPQDSGIGTQPNSTASTPDCSDTSHEESASVVEDRHSLQINVSVAQHASPNTSPPPSPRSLTTSSSSPWISPTASSPSSPWISPAASSPSSPWIGPIGSLPSSPRIPSNTLEQHTSSIVTMELSGDEIEESSNNISASNSRTPFGSPRGSNSDANVPRAVSDDVQNHEYQLNLLPSLRIPALDDISVLRLQTCFQDAGPRTQRNTFQFWDVGSEEELKYRGQVVPYVAFVPVDIKLDGKQKLCHWGCSDENGRHTVLSSGE